MKIRFKTKTLLGLTTMICVTGLTASVGSVNASAAKTEFLVPTTLAPLADFSVNVGKLQLQSPLASTIKNQGNPVVKAAPGISESAAYFDGNSAAMMPFGSSWQQQFHDQLTIEAYFRADEIPADREMDLFSNQQSGGFGLGFENGQLTFFGFTGEHYVTPKMTVKEKKWVHAVGVISDTAVSLYVDGQQVQSLPKTGTLKFTTNQNAQNLVLGGDSNSNNGAEYLFKGFIKQARVYNTALASSQISELAKTAHAHDVEEPIQVQSLQASLIGAASAVQDSSYDLNLQLRGESIGSIDQVAFNLEYDPRLVAFRGVRNNSFTKNTTIKDDKKGTVRLEYQGSISNAELIEYAKTTMAQLVFTTLPSTTEQTASFKISHLTAQVEGKPVVPKLKLNNKELKIVADDSLDFNHDGLISLSDAVLAPTDQKALVAQKAAIYPYKHVLVLTTDGGGNPWDPTGMYYANGTDAPQWTSDPAILAKRQNSYALDFFNHEASMSTSAKAIYPTMSGINYASILHGLDWNELPKDYQLDNASAGQFYFNDFGKPTSLYPSIFKVINHYQPQRTNSVFSEWSQIPNGIVEPDAAVKKEYDGTPGQSYRKVTDFINSPQFNKNAFTFLQDDSMDHTGHSTGFFNDRYWANYKVYDERFKSVIDSLKNSGHADDTLVIFNADHGGSGLNHGGASAAEANIFIGLYGQTVPKGRRLTGGSNRDITPLALNALRLPKAPLMTGSVFDPSAFMKQNELATKKRDTDQVLVGSSKQSLHFTLKQKHEVKALDLVIDLANQPKGELQVNGGKVLRDQVENGKWKITLVYDQMPTDFLTIKSATGTGNMTVEEMMLASSGGQESYNDLIDYSSEKLDTALQQAERLKPKAGYQYTKASQKRLTDAITTAKKLFQSTEITTITADQAADQLTAAIAALQEEKTAEVITVNKDKLQKAIAAAEQHKASEGKHFTETSYLDFKAALKEAKRVFHAKDADQTLVDQVLKKLTMTKAALVEVADEKNSEDSSTGGSKTEVTAESTETQTSLIIANQKVVGDGTENSQELSKQAQTTDQVAAVQEATKNSANSSVKVTRDSNQAYGIDAVKQKVFPQTNEQRSQWLVILGSVLVLLAGGINWYRQKNKKNAK